MVDPAGSSPRWRASVDRRPLGVQAAELGVEALADHLVVADEHGADQRVGADTPATALGELERPAQVGCVLFGADRWQRAPPSWSSCD